MKQIFKKLSMKMRLLLIVTFTIPLTIGGVKHELVIETIGGGCSAKFEKVKGADNEEFIGADGKQFKMRF